MGTAYSKGGIEQQNCNSVFAAQFLFVIRKNSKKFTLISKNFPGLMNFDF